MNINIAQNALWLHHITFCGWNTQSYMSVRGWIQLKYKEKFYYAYTQTHRRTQIQSIPFQIISYILMVIQVKSMWKPQWINWMGQIALKFRFIKSLLICQKADGHFFLFFCFFQFSFYFLCPVRLCPLKLWGRTLYRTKVCILWPISSTTSTNQFNACVINVRKCIYMKAKRERERESDRKKFTLNSAYVIINDGYIYLYRFT